MSRWEIALAMPKSMLFGTGRPSCTATRMFEGVRSRWMMPFWWACCLKSRISLLALFPCAAAGFQTTEYAGFRRDVREHRANILNRRQDCGRQGAGMTPAASPRIGSHNADASGVALCGAGVRSDKEDFDQAKADCGCVGRNLDRHPARGGAAAPAARRRRDVCADQRLHQRPEKNRVSDLPIRVADVGNYKVRVYGVFRPKAVSGGAIRHQTSVSEIYYMLEGTGTLVTGGGIAGEKGLGASPTTPGARTLAAQRLKVASAAES